MSKTYRVVELFDTIQGEGSRTGHRSVFVRLAGCNLWSGFAAYRDHGRGACAQWCDTNFVNGEEMTAADIGLRVRQLWGRSGDAWIVLTGGEPMLQVDRDLLFTLHALQIKIALETNGTVDSDLYADIDHVCVSPKKSTVVSRVLQRGTELKVVLPGSVSPAVRGWSTEDLDALVKRGGFQHYYLQPQDPIKPAEVDRTLLKGDVFSSEMERTYTANLAACFEHIKHDPRWKLSLQMHKYGKMR